MATLKAQSVAHFDSWAATFGEPVTAMELAPDGSGFRLHTRFARFINEANIIDIFHLFDECKAMINQNANAKIIFFDMVLNIIVMLIRK